MEIDFLLNLIEKIKNDKNYMLLKKSLNYKKNMILKVKKYNEMFNDLTFSMTHGDYSKRQIIIQNNEICGIVDFSSSDFLPISWEVIRSYFLSTLSCKVDIKFNYDLFGDYLQAYLRQFRLKDSDLIAMPYLLLYQSVLSKYGYLEYIYDSNNKDEILEYIIWKDNICTFLEEKASKLSKFISKML